MKIVVVLFNLGGPDSPEAVAPFLRNLFSDPAIIRLPNPMRWLVARLIARRRAATARDIYAKIGGRSPILEETTAQAAALEETLKNKGFQARCFIAMRYWHPFSRETVKDVAAFAPEHIVLLPLYPQFSTTTTESSFKDWDREVLRAGLGAVSHRICCYSGHPGFADAVAAQLKDAFSKRRPELSYRVLFSAHGLPKRIVDAGDPYPVQVERSVGAVMARMGESLDYNICYQSRVGPLEWIGPSTDAEILRAGKDGKAVIIVPIAFVSEHSETLVELDIEYAKLAREHHVPDYIRVPTVRAHARFIEGLADLTVKALQEKGAVNEADSRICPAGCFCAYGG